MIASYDLDEEPHPAHAEQLIEWADGESHSAVNQDAETVQAWSRRAKANGLLIILGGPDGHLVRSRWDDHDEGLD